MWEVSWVAEYEVSNRFLREGAERPLVVWLEKQVLLASGV